MFERLVRTLKFSDGYTSRFLQTWTITGLVLCNTASHFGRSASRGWSTKHAKLKLPELLSNLEYLRIEFCMLCLLPGIQFCCPLRFIELHFFSVLSKNTEDAVP